MSMPDPFAITVAATEPVPVVVVTGDLDLAVSDRAWETIEPVVSSECPGLVLDLSEVTFIDSRGLSVLARALHRMEGAPLTVRGASARVVHLFEVSGLIDLIVVE